jgi:MarR family transcriptional regulator for hemolysin
MPAEKDIEAFGPLLHGTARAWRLQLDERLRPLGLSQARWRTLLHLSGAKKPITQAEVAQRLGVEEPTLVTLLHHLERDGWVERKTALHDRRCKTVHLGKRAHGVISTISATANDLRHELLRNISGAELRVCMRVLERIREKAASENSSRKIRTPRSSTVSNGANGHSGRPARRKKPQH